MKKEKSFTIKEIEEIIEKLKMNSYSEKELECLFKDMQDIFQKNFDDIIHLSFKNFSKNKFTKQYPEYKSILTEDSIWMSVYQLRNIKKDLDFFAKFSIFEENKSILSFFENMNNKIKRGSFVYGVSDN